MKRPLQALSLLFIIAFVAGHARADVKSPCLFPTRYGFAAGNRRAVWGWADEGETVTVEFQNQKVTGAAKEGKWIVRLKPLKAGGPFTLTVTGKNRIELKNVLVGEVWICSGQSNMACRTPQTDNAEAEIANAKYPMIRLFTAPRLEVDAPVNDVKAGWKECSPESRATFLPSAITSDATCTRPEACRSG